VGVIIQPGVCLDSMKCNDTINGHYPSMVGATALRLHTPNGRESRCYTDWLMFAVLVKCWRLGDHSR
jgi:hypothetical protein